MSERLGSILSQMLFYHFTQKRNVDSILSLGLNVGLTPYRDITDFKAVSLTSVSDPTGHGLISGELVFENEPEYLAASKHFPEGVKVRANGSSSVEMFDQTEAMFVFDLNLSSPKLISHRQLFDKILTNGLMQGRPTSELAYWNAAIIHAADYPLGLEHLPDGQLEYERQQILEGNRKHKANTWFFYLERISPNKVVAVKFRQNDGLYV